MRIRFNNFFKKKTKEKSINKKNPVFKVYSGGGQIIKYEAYRINYRNNDDNKRKRKGATSFEEEIVGKFNLKEKIIAENENSNSENIRKVKKRRRDKNRSAHVLFLFMLILAGYSLYFSYSKYKELNQEDYAVYNSEEIEELIAKVEEQSSVSNNLDTIEKEEVVETSTSNTVKTEVPKVTPLSFAKPLDGEVLKIYSKDKVIYSKTLELWKTHDGIDIKADENTIVKAIEKGTVEKIYDDSFYGKTIVIDHGQGYKSSYSNLSEEVFVKEKQVVTKLAKIGKVGKTAIGEIKDESHLHFTLIKNNEICDPSSIFK